MEALLLVAVLICPIAMGVMMLLMMRRMRGHESASEESHERETR
jgi:hypothetical protein